jgi:putative membrane protein
MKFAIAALLAAAPLLAMADSPDSSFYKNLAEGGIAEVEAGKLAQEKGNSAKVKDFGAMMVKDHTAANDKLAALATTKSVTLPTTSSIGQMANKGKLEVLSGDTFDKSYIKGQVKAHRDTLELLHKEMKEGQDADAKKLAAAILPTVKAHMNAITAMAAEAGESTK